MKKYKLYVIRKQGYLFRCILIRLHRDTVTGELSPLRHSVVFPCFLKTAVFCQLLSRQCMIGLSVFIAVFFRIRIPCDDKTQAITVQEGISCDIFNLGWNC